MDRRSFLSLAMVCGTTLAFGANEEFAATTVPLKNAPLIIGSLLDKLDTVQRHVGYVKFNIISFDEMLKTAAQCNKPLHAGEIGFIETIFYGDPRRYGFFGERTVPRLTAKISENDLLYIKKTGHFLLKIQRLLNHFFGIRIIAGFLIKQSKIVKNIRLLILLFCCIR